VAEGRFKLTRHSVRVSANSFHQRVKAIAWNCPLLWDCGSFDGFLLRKQLDFAPTVVVLGERANAGLFNSSAWFLACASASVCEDVQNLGHLFCVLRPLFLKIGGW
jgi:hypothetical protein